METILEYAWQIVFAMVKGFVCGAVIAFAVFIVWDIYFEIKRAINKRNRKPDPPKPENPYMDLRLKRDPCDRCVRWSECNGVDKDECPLCEKDVLQ